MAVAGVGICHRGRVRRRQDPELGRVDVSFGEDQGVDQRRLGFDLPPVDQDQRGPVDLVNLGKGQVFLELGSGLGLGGIFLAAVTSNRQQKYLSDVHNEVLQIAELNSLASNNILGTKISVTELDWCSYDPKQLSNILTLCYLFQPRQLC